MNYKITNIHATKDIEDKFSCIEVNIFLSTGTEKDIYIRAFLIDERIKVDDIDLYTPIPFSDEVVHFELEGNQEQEITDYIKENESQILKYINSHEIPVFDWTGNNDISEPELEEENELS